MECCGKIKFGSKLILIIMFSLFLCNLNIIAQESNGSIPFNLDLPSIKKPEMESVPFPKTFQLENSLPKPKSYYDIEKPNYGKFRVNKLNSLVVFPTSNDSNFGFEGNTSVGFGTNWHITDKLTLTGSPFLSSYYFGQTDHNRKLAVGANLMLSYEVTDWLIVRTFGQYAYNGLDDPYATSLIVPQNCFGGEVLIKFSDVFGLGGGVKYVNNKGKWTPQFYTLPLIKINGAKLLKRK